MGVGIPFLSGMSQTRCSHCRTWTNHYSLNSNRSVEIKQSMGLENGGFSKNCLCGIMLEYLKVNSNRNCQVQSDDIIFEINWFPSFVFVSFCMVTSQKMCVCKYVHRNCIYTISIHSHICTCTCICIDIQLHRFRHHHRHLHSLTHLHVHVTIFFSPFSLTTIRSVATKARPRPTPRAQRAPHTRQNPLLLAQNGKDTELIVEQRALNVMCNWILLCLHDIIETEHSSTVAER